MSTPVYKWQPSTAEIAARAGIEPSQVVRFDQNTSPYPPPWGVGGFGLNEYPAADYRPLREAAARYSGVRPEQVVPGAGADEMIMVCSRAFLPPGGRSVGVVPGYTLYRITTAHRAAEWVGVPAPPPDFPLPVAELAAAAAGADVVWLCDPDNPTGRADDPADLERIIAAARGVVVLDAAYAEFAASDPVRLLDRHPNLIVLRTLSKAFGLAAIRVGYSVSAPDLAARLDGVRPPGSVSTISATIAAEALAEPVRARLAADRLAAEREHLAPRLAALGMRVLPSAANFLLCEVGPGARDVADALLAAGLVVRTFEDPPLQDYLRFTIRTRTDHDRLVTALEAALERSPR